MNIDWMKILSLENKTISNIKNEINKNYNIIITKEYLLLFVNFATKTMNYYNQKYKIYNQDELTNIYYFLMDTEACWFYNLIHSYWLNNNEYINFLKILKNLDYNNLLNVYQKFCEIIQIQINLFTNDKISLYKNNDKYIKTTLNIKRELKALPVNPLLYSYIYLNYKDDLKTTLSIIEKKIENELSDIQNGKCELLEMITLMPHKMYGLSKNYSKTYLSKLFETENLCYTNYNEHLNILNIIKEYFE